MLVVDSFANEIEGSRILTKNVFGKDNVAIKGLGSGVGYMGSNPRLPIKLWWGAIYLLLLNCLGQQWST